MFPLGLPYPYPNHEDETTQDEYRTDDRTLRSCFHCAGSTTTDDFRLGFCSGVARRSLGLSIAALLLLVLLGWYMVVDMRGSGSSSSVCDDISMERLSTTEDGRSLRLYSSTPTNKTTHFTKYSEYPQ